MRARKPKNLDARLERYADAIEHEPSRCWGRWLETYLPQGREVRLDLGCGKGEFTVQSALAEPDVLFVGLDREDVCVAGGARKALLAGAPNVVFAHGDADTLGTLFAPGELAQIHLNFCTPHPQSKYAPRRLTHLDHLLAYRDLLAQGGTVRFKTDHVPLYEFSLTQFELAGYRILWQTCDLHAMNPGEIRSEYESKLGELGAVVHALLALVGPRPEVVEQTAELSLAAYLPHDLESLAYVPYGMEDTVRNILNRRANEARKAKIAAKRAAKAARAAADAQEG